MKIQLFEFPVKKYLFEKLMHFVIVYKQNRPGEIFVLNSAELSAHLSQPLFL